MPLPARPEPPALYAPCPCPPAAAAELRHRPVPPPRTEESAGPRGDGGRSGMETYLGLEEFQYMGSKTMERASAVLHKTITAPQQYFQAEASRLRAAMVAGGTESLPGASPTPPCAFPRT